MNKEQQELRDKRRAALAAQPPYVHDWDAHDEHAVVRHVSARSLRNLIHAELRQHGSQQLPPLSGEEIRAMAREAARDVLKDAIAKSARPGFLARLRLLFFSWN